MVMKKAGSVGGSPQDKSPKGGGEAADGGPNQFSMGRGKRRQLFVTMVGNSKVRMTPGELMATATHRRDTTEGQQSYFMMSRLLGHFKAVC